MAEIPKNTQPARFTAAILHSRSRRPARRRAGSPRGRREPRDQKGRRAEEVGCPNQPIVLVGGQPVLHRLEGAEVEQQGAGELDGRAPPRRVGSPAAEPQRGLAQLEQRSEREEDRAGEEHHAVGAGADEVDEPGKRADEEACRPDREPDGDPAVPDDADRPAAGRRRARDRSRCPPDHGSTVPACVRACFALLGGDSPP